MCNLQAAICYTQRRKSTREVGKVFFDVHPIVGQDTTKGQEHRFLSILLLRTENNFVIIGKF
jgi:hypothetical protein